MVNVILLNGLPLVCIFFFLYETACHCAVNLSYSRARLLPDSVTLSSSIPVLPSLATDLVTNFFSSGYLLPCYIDKWMKQSAITRSDCALTDHLPTTAGDSLVQIIFDDHLVDTALCIQRSWRRIALACSVFAIASLSRPNREMFFKLDVSEAIQKKI